MADSFSISLNVRDYECDLQGIVNNSVYQNYFEHARHEYLKHHEMDFADLTAKNIFLVVTRIEIDYKFPLVSGDAFAVTADMYRESKVRWGFLQQIVRHRDGKLMAAARVIGTSLNERGRPFAFADLDRLESITCPTR